MGLQGKGESQALPKVEQHFRLSPFPCIIRVESFHRWIMREQDLFGQQGDSAVARMWKWLWMKFFAGLAKNSNQQRQSRCYEYVPLTQDVFWQRLEQRDALCFQNEHSDEVWN
jgi:hypothetical protein